MQNTFKVGDDVRLVHLDGTLSESTFKIHDLWGTPESNRNASFMLPGSGEEFTHTDLLKLASDDTPVVVPDGGEWYIARGSNMCWGRARSIEAATRNMKSQGGKLTAYVVHRVSKWTQVDGMGSLTYPIGIDPVEVKRFEPNKKKA